jgi:hypothetical protein
MGKLPNPDQQKFRRIIRELEAKPPEETAIIGEDAEGRPVEVPRNITTLGKA